MKHEQTLQVSEQLLKAAKLHQDGKMNDDDFKQAVKTVWLLLDYHEEDEKIKLEKGE